MPAFMAARVLRTARVETAGETAVAVPAADAVAGRLSTLDRFLPVWIGIAMATGLLLGRLVPGLGSGLSAVEVQGISLPIAVGLLAMM
jgi:ACR3 family arsenite efflux pump ArsB